MKTSPSSYVFAHVPSYTAVGLNVFDACLRFECIIHYPTDNEGEEVTLGTFMAVCAVCVVFAISLYAGDIANIKACSRGKSMSREAIVLSCTPAQNRTGAL